MADCQPYSLADVADECFLSCERGFSVLSKSLSRMAEEALLRCEKACTVGRNGLYDVRKAEKTRFN